MNHSHTLLKADIRSGQIILSSMLLFIILSVFFCQPALGSIAQSHDSIPGYKHPVTGVVYWDNNGNGKQDKEENGISGIAVSDGREIVLTDRSGMYLLPNSEKKAFFVFVHQVSDFKQSGQHFFHRLLEAEDTASFNFGFQQDRTGRTSGESTSFVQLSDSHIRDSSDRDYMKQATSEIYNMDPVPDFIVCTGDMVDWGVDEHFQNYVEGMQKPPVPYFNVFGNHEIVFGPIERYYSYLGPDYYSFEQKGIVYIAVNCVTPTERQDEWLKNTIGLLVKGRPVVIFQHFPPSLTDIERYRDMGVHSIFSGHWHSEKEMEYAGVQSINTPPFIMGGIDASPAGFKIVYLQKDGSAETEWRYGFQNKLLNIVSPQENTPLSADVAIIVNAYHTSHDVAYVDWQITDDKGRQIDSGRLEQVSALTWMRAKPAKIRPNHYTISIQARDKQGTSWKAARKFSVSTRQINAPATRGSWPVFMGNSGHTGSTLSASPRLPLRLVWSVDTGGDPDFSSVILADGRLYLTNKKRTRGRSNGVAAYDPATGRKLWFYESEMAVNHSPAYHDGVLCVAEMGGRVLGLDAKTGKKLWEHDLIDNRGRYNYGAPTAHDGWFYVGVLRRTAKIRPSDGQVQWEKQIGENDNDWISSYGSPAVSGKYLAMSGMYFRGEVLNVASTDDGIKIWGHNADDGMLASPSIAGDRIYFTSMKSVLYARQLSDGGEIWSTELGADSNKTNVLGLATDGNAKWSATTSAIKVNKENSGIIVAGSGDGYMSGIDLANGKILWTHASGPTIFKVSPYRRDRRPLLSSPTIAGDKVFFGSADGYLYCLDLQTGQQLWSFNIGVPVLSTPLVSGNAVFVAAYDGMLYALTSAGSK